MSVPMAEYSPSQLLPSSLRGLLSSLACCGVDHTKGSVLAPVIFKNNSFHLLNLDLDFFNRRREVEDVATGKHPSGGKLETELGVVVHACLNSNTQEV